MIYTGTIKRTIRPHKGGRTARAPEARIRPQTRDNIWATLNNQGVTWGDWLEEQFSGGNMNSKVPDEEIATDYDLWEQYADPQGTMSEAEFDALSVDEKIKMLHEMFPQG